MTHKKSSHPEGNETQEVLPVDENALASLLEGDFFEPHHKLGEELALRILSTAQWIYRGAPVIPDIDAEKNDYHTAEKRFKKEYQSITFRALLEKLTEEQAQVFWFQRGRTESSQQEKDDDYHNAKRFVAFLLTDMLLDNCRKDGNCLIKHFKGEYIDYLRVITIHEYIRYKAFFRWQADFKNGYPRFHYSPHKDYLDEIEELDAALIHCGKSKWDDMVKFWAEVFCKQLDECGLEKIKQAKKNSLTRLWRLTPKQDLCIGSFVDSFYDHMYEQLTQQGWLEKPIAETVLTDIYKKTDIVTMLEYLIRCPIICSIDVPTHNRIRENAGKQPLKVCTVDV